MKRPTPELPARLEELVRLCRRHGLPVTVQRRVVLQTLLEGHDHPTADEVYDEARRRIPGISRTTVYRVLETLVRLGVIARACTPGSAVRYDSGTHRHHHLVCVQCDRVLDLEAKAIGALRLPDTRRLGFRIQNYSVHFKGVCAECRAAERPSPAFRGRRRPPPDEEPVR